MKKNLKFIIVVINIFLVFNNLQAQLEYIQVGSTNRTMYVYAPPGIEKDRPLLLSLHGLNQDINYQRNQAQWETVAEENNFVVVYPGGIDNSWDIWGTRDVDFILAIIDEMNNRYGIDRNRVYLSGFSMGGMMTYHAANYIADKIAAFAPVSGYLMQGPNTNSLRPIPIIHTHGTSDNVVSFSGVQTCLDAWITRNECPTTAQVTKPYPSNKPGSNATKYYWGPGTDNVEIVLLKLEGVGHWHSINPNGVNTSQEIWNFCKKFSLGFGVPEFQYASVNDSNPKQVQLMLSESIADSNYFEGFIIKLDDQIATIDSVVLDDTNQLIINLSDSILNENDITISYNSGNVVSIYEKKLENFNDTLVDNLLTGASPRLIEIATDEDGDTILTRFNKKMLLPSDVSTLTLKAEYNGEINIPILQGSYYNNDSSILFFPLDEKVYADYELSLSYSGSNVASSDSGFLKTITDFQVTNNSKGLPVHIVSGKVENDGYTVELEFSKPMLFEDRQTDNFTFDINRKNVSFNEFFVLNNTIRLTLLSNIHYGDTVSLSYVPGDVTAADKGELESFTDFAINNPISEPNWITIPSKIEAENYLFQSGVQTETTGDASGGLNVGWIDNGDWLEYAIENNESDTIYQFSFRVASPSSGGRIDVYIGTKKIDQVTVPNTGNWQIWQSVNKELNIPQGKHYLKLIAAKGGFNINYVDITQIVSGIKKLSGDKINVYPNPVSDELIINPIVSRYNKIEIIDVMGNRLINNSVAFESEIHLPVNLPNGMYFIKISNENQHYQIKKIIVKK